MKVPENDPIAVSNQIPIIPNFKGKWSIIKSKLANLDTQLFDFSDFPVSTSNPLAIELIYSVSGTLNDVVSLAEKFQRLDLAEGKLKTQSDIDSVMAKLDRHIRDDEILIRSGVLQDEVVSGSSKKETVRVEARNLMWNPG